VSKVNRLDQRFPVDGIVQRQAEVDVINRWLGVVDVQNAGESKGVFFDPDVRQTVDGVDLAKGHADADVDVPSLQLEHAGVVVGDKLNLKLIHNALYSTVRVAHEGDVVRLHELFYHVGPTADRQAKKVFFPSCFQGGLGKDRGPVAGHVAQEGHERLVERKLDRIVVDGFHL
jgi:hypothetical protein